MVRVKLCGFTRGEDVQRAVELGVDYVGIVLYHKSPRYVPKKGLEELLKVGGKVKKVAVMVNPSPGEVEEAFELGFDLVQLHGDEDCSLAQKVDLERVIKAFRTCPHLEIPACWKRVHGLLLDACSELYGGSGKRADWYRAKALVEEGFRVFLAGGLNPSNVKEALLRVRPYCVDVSSGIEQSPGIKDHRKMEEFVRAVKDSPED
ncbi:MAG: phosphoribosylanthranilate isomerase [Aquificaceae bacterium]|nr:phosphoribosylanthranilate isomerase [Aquificaceae bacterium]MCX8059980.1 phosphoribosylanthranilate isomerase [Aquificaceae bacterium]MDW8096998.1 phosphoribosylanthranilate isomerase [Aquificaceae bacterium]